MPPAALNATLTDRVAALARPNPARLRSDEFDPYKVSHSVLSSRIQEAPQKIASSSATALLNSCLYQSELRRSLLPLVGAS